MSSQSEFSDSYCDDDCWGEISAMLQTVKHAIMEKRRKKKLMSKFLHGHCSEMTSLHQAHIKESHKVNELRKAKSDQIVLRWKADLDDLRQHLKSVQEKLDAYKPSNIDHSKRLKTAGKLIKSFRYSSDVIDGLHHQQLAEKKKFFTHELKKAATKHRESMNKRDLSHLKMQMQWMLCRL